MLYSTRSQKPLSEPLLSLINTLCGQNEASGKHIQYTSLLATSVSLTTPSPHASIAATRPASPWDDSIPDCGDFVDSGDEIDIEEGSEDRDRYLEGLYYPICIGEVVENAYRIEHKLGYGGFSTVWMARDTQTSKLVALKIMIPGEEGEHELSIQKEILKTMPDTSQILTYQDTFTLQGLKDTHRVLVFPMRGPSIYMCSRKLPAATRMSAAKQLFEILKRLHDSGIVHCDLNNGSVMWDVAPLDEYDLKTKYEYLGRPRKTYLWNGTWKLGELVHPMEVPQTLLRDKIFLGDFGLSIKAGTPVKCKWQAPSVYCAPERFHNVDPSFATDMWSYMCLFAELYIDIVPFRGGSNTSMLTHLAERLGPLPAQWNGTYNAGGESSDSWYDQSRTPSGLEPIFARARPDASQDEQDLVLSVLSKGFCYLSENRLTAAQLLEDTSFKALMEIYGC